MKKREFANIIIQKLQSSIGVDGSLYNKDTANLARNAVSLAITEYLVSHVIVTVSYNGVTSVGAPDPIVQDKFNIIGSCATIGPAKDFNEWIKLIERNIINGFTLAPNGKSGVVFACKPFVNVGIATTQDSLKNLHRVDDSSCQNIVWEEICKGLIDWITGISNNLIPGPATRPSGSSSGTAQITNISLV